MTVFNLGTRIYWFIGYIFITTAFSLPGYAVENVHIQLTPEMIEKSKLTMDIAGAETLLTTRQLFGVVSAIPERHYRVNAVYSGVIAYVMVSVGDEVKKGQLLAKVLNTNTFQTYNVTAPAGGIVTTRWLNTGDRADGPLLELIDLSSVWIELSAFSTELALLKTGANMQVQDLQQHLTATTQLSYISPQMSGGYATQLRAVVDNSSGYWRPGMRVKADIEVETIGVPLAVKKSAVQTVNDHQVVFIRLGNVFEMREIKTGRENEHYLEVISGLDNGAEYVSGNSFLLKSDVLKATAGEEH